MFATFLIVTVLASLAALAVLLATPRPVGGAPLVRQDVPWTGLGIAVLLAALGFVGGRLWGA